MKSLEQRTASLLKKAFWICFEDNPARVGWELHGMNCDVEITMEKFIKPDEYYLINVYMTTEMVNKLFDIVEGFPMWIDTYKSCRTSIYNMLNVYTSENLEKILSGYEADIKLIEKERNNFVRQQKPQTIKL